ncbi:MAG: hypothetical protein OMM_07552 [Candidatus Magnetoglobus multicellularis str. Araruama]|uniref:TonB-dependent receptor n=1 Tax=Candidatus Magnetoglobus multicellularis str. Araruama TaxID=890399 RepID=A0A1V1PC58_9BACT|nr:MAG: hypothetical protein OMM_07552 [Candidatus Magnetoglobus multicellularis str. Araruama]
MKHLAYTLFIILTLTSQVCASYSGVITGTITDKYTNEPIDQATITTASDRSAISFSNGAFWMMLIQPFTHTLIVQAEGYKMYSCVVDVPTFETIVVDIRMEPDEKIIQNEYSKFLIKQLIQNLQFLAMKTNHDAQALTEVIRLLNRLTGMYH